MNHSRILKWMLPALGVLTISTTLSPTARAEVRRTDFHLEADLINAAANGETYVVRDLLNKGASIETRDSQFTWTPLMWAARSGHVGTVRFLLARGARVNARSVGSVRTYMTLSMGRAVNDVPPASTDSATAPPAVQSGFGTANNGVTPLMLASAGGYNLAAKELLNKGADVNAASSSGETPLMAAAFNGYLPLVRTLLARGARVGDRDTQGGTALAGAVLEGHTAVVEVLLDHKAPANELYMRRVPLLTLAKYYNYTDIARMLQRHGARLPVSAAKTSKNSKKSATQQAKDTNKPGAPAASGPNVMVLN